MKKKALGILLPLAAVIIAAVVILWQNGVFAPKVTGDAAGTAHVVIRCDRALAYENLKDGMQEILPEDGVMADAVVTVYTDDTVFTVLQRVCQENKIALSYRGATRYGVYVEGIGGLFEMDCGGVSGWMVSVNGSFIDKSAGDTPASNGDEILWVYTLDGKDVLT